LRPDGLRGSPEIGAAMNACKVKPTENRDFSEWHLERDGKIIRSPLILVAPDGHKINLHGAPSRVPWNKINEALRNEIGLGLKLAPGDKIFDHANEPLFEFSGQELVLDPQMAARWKR
jgi:hypothetical protein